MFPEAQLSLMKYPVFCHSSLLGRPTENLSIVEICLSNCTFTWAPANDFISKVRCTISTSFCGFTTIRLAERRGVGGCVLLTVGILSIANPREPLGRPFSECIIRRQRLGWR